MELTRRRVLGAAMSMVIGGIANACATSTPNEPGADPDRRVTSGTPGPIPKDLLVAFFSRPGENYHYGGRVHLDTGNTEVLATMITDRLGCDVYNIKAADPYPGDYDATVRRNVDEQNQDARPVIANPLASIEPYRTILVGSPIWNVRPPMIMRSFLESFDFTGKVIHPFTTHAMSGLGTAMEDYRRTCPTATIGEGLAVRGEEVTSARDTVHAWLQRINVIV
jgi:flavodoxin